jgi:uncharacterized membrane protein
LEDQSPYCAQCGGAIAWEQAAATTETPPNESSPKEAAVVQERLAPHSGGVELPIPENVAAVVAYITPIPAVLFLYLEPFRRNVFVRFHAFQHVCLVVAALACAIVSFVLWMVLQMIPFMRVLVFPFVGLISLAWFFLWLLLVVKAYHHEWFKLPLIGDFAEEWSRAQP